MRLLNTRQLEEWLDYSRREPFGFPWQDLAVAAIQATTANVWGAKVSPEQFKFGPVLAEAWRKEEEPTTDDLIDKLKALFPPPPGILGPDGQPLRK